MTFIPTDQDVLLIIDAMRAFCPGGGLPVNAGHEIMPGIADIAAQFSQIVVVKDWHPQGHSSFASTHGVEPFSTVQASYGDQTAWPDHAIAGTPDADLMPEIEALLPSVSAIIHKGMNPEIDSYSAFYENDRKTPTGLAGYLLERGIKRVFIVGLAYDYCVGFSALDAKRRFGNVYVIYDLTRGIATPTGDGRTSIDDMQDAFDASGVTLITSDRIKGAKI